MIGGDLRIGEWLVQQDLGRMTRGDEVVHVEPKLLDVLVFLADRSGSVVSREELLAGVWPDTIVADTAVSRSISDLRRILGDDSKRPTYIATVHKRGYRLIAPVERLSRSPRQIDSKRRRVLWLTAATVVVVLVVFLLVERSPRSVPPSLQPLSRVVLTSSTDLEYAPTLASDRQSLAYVRARPEGTKQLFKVQIQLAGDVEPRELTSGRDSEGAPAWSPDGASIALWTLRATTDELAVVPVLGGPATPLSPVGIRAGAGISWAGDGTWLAAAWRAAEGGPMIVHRVAVDGVIEALTTPPPGWYGDIYPSVAPSGDAVAFVRSSVEGQEHDVYVVSIASGDVRRLTFDHKPIRGLAWRSDGKSLLFASKRTNEYALWEVRVDSGELSWTGISNARSPAFAQGSDSLVYEHVEREINIWRVEVGEHGETRSHRMLESTRGERTPDICPDGRSIAFSSGRTGSVEIWMSDADGHALQRLTDLRGYATWPRWSLDGRRIAFSADVDQNHDIYVIDTPGNEPRRLTVHSGSDQMPSWSADGQWLFFASMRSGSWEIWKTPSGGGDSEQVTFDGGFASHASQDGRWLYFAKPDGETLWRLSLAEGRVERVLATMDRWRAGSWDVIDNRIVFGRSKEDRVELLTYFPDLKETRFVVELPEGAESELAFSEDLSTILFSRLDRQASDIHGVQLASF